MKITVLYEDKDVVAIDKPAGLSVHGDGVRDGDTLTDWILKKYPKMKGVGEPGQGPNGEEIDRPGIVHRLDKDTSGVLVLAKSQEAYEFLKEQFHDRETEKTYRVLVQGLVKDDVGLIQVPIGKSKADFRKRTTSDTVGTMRDSTTEYKVLERFDCGKQLGYGVTYLEAYPKTGRTHQIRVHMKWLHHPVLCDSLYGGKNACIPELGRLALHAAALTLTLPSGGKKTFESPLPVDFAAALDLLRSSC